MSRSLIWVALFLLCISRVSSAAPVALVENISAEVKQVQLLDFLSPGDEIQLAESDEITLGYMGSCIREQIQGGKIVIGAEQSKVEEGQVSRETTQCDGGRLLLIAEQAAHSGAVAVRVAPGDTSSRLTVHDTQPLLILPKGGKVTIKRLDVKGERHKIRTGPSKETLRLDLAKEGIELTPGGRYMVSSSGRSLVFTVSENASHNEQEILGRVIPL